MVVDVEVIYAVVVMFQCISVFKLRREIYEAINPVGSIKVLEFLA